VVTYQLGFSEIHDYLTWGELYHRKMCRDNATPNRPDPEGLHFLLGKTLVGWEEIRQALEFVEEHRKHGIHSHVRIEVYEYGENSNLKVTFRTVSELDEYLHSRFRGMLLKGVGDSLKIDDIQRASDEVYARFNEMADVHGLVILN
jgi:hypothetical protein